MTYEINEIRRANMRELAKRYASLKDFGTAIGKSGTHVSQLIGKRPRRNIGSAIARQVEMAFSLPLGWLDREHSESDTPSAAKAAAKTSDIDTDLLAACIRGYRQAVLEAELGQVSVKVEARCISIMYSVAVQMGGRLPEPLALVRALTA